MAADETLLELIKQHVESDQQQFESQAKTLDEIRTDVKSLLLSRAKTQGMGKILAAAAGSGGLISIVFELYKRFTH